MNKKIKNAIIKLCLRESSYDVSYYERICDVLADVDWSMLSIKPSDFVNVYRFKAGGNYFLVHNFDNEILFRGKRAVLLFESVEMFTSEVFCSAEIFEIWLTVDMEIEFVGCFRMDIDGSGGNYTAEYRYPMNKDYHEQFDIDCFLDNFPSHFGINKNNLSS